MSSRRLLKTKTKDVFRTSSRRLHQDECLLGDFFQDDNNVQKVKTRNLLTNVSYRRYKPEDVEKPNFVINVFSFLTQNLNLTGLNRKVEIPLERDFVKMIWDSCVPHKSTKFIYLK